MPFGPYSDFADCVAKNQDASNPEALCAWLHHQITGKWPTEAKHPQAKLEDFANQVDQAVKEAINKFTFQAMPSRTIVGVPIFTSGKHTDSTGMVREWTEAALQGMAERFKQRGEKHIPLKVGHTSDSFNIRIAKALNLPPELIAGDKGQGQIALGEVTGMECRDGKIIATVGNVPEAIADLVEGKQYNSVSCEIEGNEKDGWEITAVALLGAEEPAIAEASLVGAKVFGKLEAERRVVMFSQEQSPSKDKKKSLEEKMTEDEKSKFQNDSLVAIALALGLPGEAKLEDILKVITDMKGMMPQPGAEEEMKQHKAEFAKVTEKISILEKENAELKHGWRVAKYQKLAADLTAIEGKPEDMGKDWAELEEKAGEAVVSQVIAQFQKANTLASGMLTSVGRSKTILSNPQDEFEIKVNALAKEKGLSFQKALAAMADKEPKQFSAYKERMREVK